MTITPFKKKEKERIVSIISSNPYYMSQLEGRMLPTELHHELSKEKIMLFPSTWKQMGMKCSCPDWAVPCKHLAAVVYIIANEIDKNPFLVFGMHNFDLVKELNLSSGRSAEEDIISIASLTVAKPKKFNYYREKLEYIDFSEIPDLSEPISKLLTERPLFYLKNDFKKIMTDQYKKMSKAVKKHIKITDIVEESPELLYNSVDMRIYKGKALIAGKLKVKDKKLSFDSEDMDNLIEYLQVLTIGDLSVYPPVLSFLTVIHSFVLKLIEKSAYVPDIISLSANTYIIRWIPALFSGKIKQIYTNLCDAMPRDMLKYGNDFLSANDQVFFILSMFINYYMDKFQALPLTEEVIPDLFFHHGTYVSKEFQDKENAKTINLWLGRFFIHPKNCAPVIRIDETVKGDSFLFNLFIDDGRNDNNHEGIKSFMASDNDEKFPVLKDLSLLSTHLPVVNDVLKKQGKVTVVPEEFVSLWFDALPVLKTLGIRTILPKALSSVFIPQLTLTAKSVSGGAKNIKSYMNLKSMLNFDWNIAAGNTFMGVEEFQELIGKYSGIVKFKDQYIYLDAREMERILKQLDKKPSLSPLDILKVHLEESYKGVPIKTDAGLKKIFKELFTPKETSLPVDLKADLRPYQLSGFKWLYHNYSIGIGSIIADDMGLGKTLQVIAVILKMKQTGDLKTKKVLAIVPASVMLNWQREIEKFAPSLKSIIYHGQKRDREILKQQDTDVIITTYSLARMDKDIFSKIKWRCIVTDEAQNIKNAETSQTKAVKSIKGDYKIAMTGTPVENRLMDYWSITDFTMKNLLGNKTTFKQDFAIPIEKFNNQKRLEAFKKITAPFILRRMKTDKTIISDLPDKISMDHWVSLSKEQTALYQDLVDTVDAIDANVDGINRKGLIFKLIIGFKQICNHPSLYLKNKTANPELSGKSVLLLDLLQKITNRKEKVLIFTQFKEMGTLLEKMIEDNFHSKPMFFHGSLGQKKRNEIIDNFQNTQEHNVLIISLKAGGTGLNLTAANNVIHYDLWWNPAVENQATDRAFRIGQKRNVNVYRFITKGTFEERINDMI
ncbi:MAG: SNF2-related protein, partial [Spirochaetota bacterium]|nr:SNF2-related protein [Spirochaetota bacterium]